MFNLAIAAATYRGTIASSAIVCLAAATAVAYLLPVRYTATAVILPPQQNQSLAASMLGQLANSGLAAVAGSSVGLKNPNDMYVGMLKSRSIADALVQQFDLRAVYDQKTLWETRKKLAKYTDISTGKDSLIVVAVEDTDRARAASMANAYIERLTSMTQRLAITEASQRRLFFEARLGETRDALAAAELSLKQAQQKSGLIQPDAQARAIITAIADARAQVAAREVQLKAMRTYATAQNVGVVLAEEELAGLRQQLAKLERQHNSGAGDVHVPTTQLPEVGLEYVRRLRDVKYYEAMVELLSRQFEAAKLDEAKQVAPIQVVDRATEPDKRSSPNRGLIIAFGGIAGVALGVAYAAFASSWLEDTNRRSQLRLVRDLFLRPLI
jgi:uncharacterized protein involved in exopolysaccharide biosynthesis